MQKIIAGGALAGALAVSAVAGVLALGTGAANAADPTASPAAAATTTPATGGTPDVAGPGGHGGFGGHSETVSDASVAAKAIGITEAQLTTALSSGKSLADVAKANSVDPQKVIDALMAPIIEHEKAEVTSGEDTQAKSDQELADAKTHITDFVNGKLPAPAAGVPGGGPGGPGGPGPRFGGRGH